MKLNTLIFVLLVVVASSCSSASGPEEVVGETKARHAQWFTTSVINGYRVVTVLDPFDTTRPATRLVLYNRDSVRPGNLKGYTPVPVPLQRVAVTSSTAITFAEKCGHLDAVVSVSDAGFVFNPRVRQKLLVGQITEVAQGTEIYYEKLSASNPEAIFVSMFDGQSLERIHDLGIVVIPFADYLETTPLGRAEWVRFMGLFFKEEELTNQLFDSIAMRYNHIKQLAEKATDRPQIFDGLPFEGTWYVSGGQSYMAAMYRDASANYLWNNEPGNGSVVMAYEKVFALAAKVPWWRMVVNIPDTFTTQRLLSLDERYALFDAVSKGGVIWSNAANIPLFELGVAEPDKVLADLVSILHPGLLPNHRCSYYFILKP